MAQTGLPAWSRTAATNNTADSAVNWQEGQAPSSVNDSARGMMASTAKWRDDNSGALATSGTSTAYTLTTYTGMDALAENYQVAFQIDEDCGTPVTLNVDSKGAKPLRSAAGVELIAGALKAGGIYSATYKTSNSGEWILHNATTALTDGQVATAKIADAAVNNAKLANMANATIKGRATSGTGVPEDLTLTQALDFIGSPTRGDVLVRGASTWGRVALGGAGSVIGSDGTDTKSQPAGGQVFYIAETQSAGTSSGVNFSGASWTKLGFNTTFINDISGASHSGSNQTTLPAGTYDITLRVPAPQNGGSSIYFKSRFRNVTDSTTAFVSATAAWTGGGVSGGSFPIEAFGRVTIASTKVFESQFYQNAATGQILGGNRSSSYAENEIYSELIIRKIA